MKDRLIKIHLRSGHVLTVIGARFSFKHRFLVITGSAGSIVALVRSKAIVAATALPMD